MTELLQQQIPLFLLVLIRMTSFFIIAPIFSYRAIPNRFKIGFGFFVSLAALPVVDVSEPVLFNGFFFTLLVKEITIGILMGFIAAMIIYTVQVSGAFIDFQMGFAIANLVDPQTGAQIPVISQFKYLLTMLFLVTVDAHHLMLDAIMKSYEVIKIDQLISLGNEDFAIFMVTVFSTMFLTAAQISLPIVASLFLVDVGLGLLAKTVPQINVFVVGLPLKIFVGFVLLLITIPVFFFLLQSIFLEIMHKLGELLKIIGV
jgi:flagellar biosynthesis protein FliR